MTRSSALLMVLFLALGFGCDSTPTCGVDPVRCVDSATCEFREVVSGCDACPSGTVAAALCEPPPVDAGSSDAGSDSGPADAGPVDSGAVDSGSVDSGSADAGTVDSGPADAGAVDAGPAECGDFCTPTCFRPYNCVRFCGGPVTSCGCCSCAEGSIDDITCSSES